MKYKDKDLDPTPRLIDANYRASSTERVFYPGNKGEVIHTEEDLAKHEKLMYAKFSEELHEHFKAAQKIGGFVGAGLDCNLYFTFKLKMLETPTQVAIRIRQAKARIAAAEKRALRAKNAKAAREQEEYKKFLKLKKKFEPNSIPADIS